MSALSAWLAPVLRECIELLLVTSVSCALILLLRKAALQAFGARAAYALWALLPATFLGASLPAPPVSGTAPTFGWELSAVMATSSDRQPGSATLLLTSCWLIGVCWSLISLARAQRRFIHALGPIRQRGDGLWQASTGKGLPALVGLFPKIVLPNDFDRRYSLEQQRLIIEHERVHARRGDQLWNLLFALLCALFWFNPLLRLAQRAFQLDQELACDALVLARFPEGRQDYGEALLRVPTSTPASPIACPAFGTHPLKERILMLIQPAPSRPRRIAGLGLIFGLCITAAGLTWANQSPEMSFDKAASVGSPLLTDAETTPADTSAAPTILSAKPPRYPVTALKQGIQGTSMVFARVRADGSVAETRIERSSGNDALDHAALEVVRDWTFQPARQDGQAIDSTVLVPVQFSLGQPPDAAAEGDPSPKAL